MGSSFIEVLLIDPLLDVGNSSLGNTAAGGSLRSTTDLSDGFAALSGFEDDLGVDPLRGSDRSASSESAANDTFPCSGFSSSSSACVI